ncbi:heme-binding protein [bacterium]|nr:heme-binding protein [bacterium]
MKRLVLAILSVVFPFEAKAVEEPNYQEDVVFKDFMVRSYGPLLVAQTEVDESFDDAGSRAFRILADYIFGNNSSRTKIEMTAPVVQQKREPEKISMTAPVIQEKSQRGYFVQFTMPAKYTRETVPEPKDSRVTLREVPARKVAVFSYSGSWSQKKYDEKLADFRIALERERIRTKGEPSFARFNSPWQLWFLRRNEIWLEVSLDGVNNKP